MESACGSVIDIGIKTMFSCLTEGTTATTAIAKTANSIDCRRVAEQPASSCSGSSASSWSSTGFVITRSSR